MASTTTPAAPLRQPLLSSTPPPPHRHDQNLTGGDMYATARNSRNLQWSDIIVAPYPLRLTGFVMLPIVIVLISISAYATSAYVANLQWKGKPPCRKSPGAFAILNSKASPSLTAIIWSGVSKGEKLLHDAWLYRLDRPMNSRWIRIPHDDLASHHHLSMPQPRTKSSIATFGDSFAVMFGGDPNLQPPLEGVFFDDTWIITERKDKLVKTFHWYQVNTTVKPKKRRAHAATITRDAKNRSVASYWLYGGRNESGGVFRDVWQLPLELDDEDNILIDANSSIINANWRCVYGCNDTAVAGWELIDVWKWWKDRDEPIPRKGHSLTSSSSKNAPAAAFILAFGRLNNWMYMNDIWQFVPAADGDSGGTWQLISALDFLPNETSDLNGHPMPRDHHAAFRKDDTLYFFGGRGGLNQSHDLYGPLGDLWKFNLTTSNWKCGNESTAGPAARWLPGADKYGNGRFVVFGGESYDEKKLNDLWEFDMESSTWQLRSSSTC